MFSEHVTQEQIQTDITNNIRVIPLSETIAVQKHKKIVYIPIDIARITVNAPVDSGSPTSALDKKLQNKNTVPNNN